MQGIGDRIREHRKKLGMTQRELAEKIDVSTQAVSKWECGTGMPDISQIVPLSQALGIGADTLLGGKHRYNELNRKWQKACMGDDRREEYYLRLIKIEKEALIEFPCDATWQYRYAYDFYFLSLVTKDGQKKEYYLHRAEGVCFRAIEKHPDFDSLYGLMVRILVAEGRRSEALGYAYKSKDRDMILKYCLEGDELRRHRQKLINRKLEALLAELVCKDESFLNIAEDIANTVRGKEDFPSLDYVSVEIYCNRAAIYAQQGDRERARETLCIAYRKAMDTTHLPNSNNIRMLEDLCERDGALSELIKEIKEEI